MERYYYIDASGFIEYVGKFNSNDDAIDFIEDTELESFWLFSQTYLENFIKFANSTMKYQKDKQ